MKLLLHVFLLIIFQMGIIAHAQMADIDYSDAVGPVRDQSNIGICYAAAVADALSFESHQRISTISLAVHYRLQRPVKEKLFMTPFSQYYEAGIADSVLRAAFDNNLCTDNKINEDYNYGFTNENLQSLGKKYEQFRSYFGPKEPIKLKNEILDLVAKIFPNQNPMLFKEQFKFRHKPIEEAVKDFLNSQCRFRIPSSKYQVLTIKDQKLFAKAISVALRSKKIPIIHYNRFPLRDEKEALSEKIANRFVGTHVNTIFGMRIRNGKTQYLLRETSSEYICESYKEIFQQYCVAGQTWLNESFLLPLVTSVTFLTNKKAP